ncbi:MAG: CoA-binding protein [Acidimicrobiia bacterium]|nr:CoA-binding protein [Acidimicrobiia bacterium]MDH5236904.1 CoA-binding protein [Acidimicrobiia bacterium]
MTTDLSPLFEPRGVVVAGASSHPGKFGFVSLHNILACGYEGDVFALGREAGEVLGVQVLDSADQIPEGRADLVFVCTPPSANEALIREVAARGVRAVFMAAGGYSEAGADGRAAEDDLVALCDELGLILAGPNGQGVVSPPVDLCAQIVAPYPPRGAIAIASQSGNFVSSFQNYATQTGIGVSRAVSAGNAAQLGIVDYLDWFAQDPQTAVSLIYVEGIEDGRQFYERAAAVARVKPIVVLKGGASTGGQRAAASHTGALATDDAVFDGMCRQAGLVRARNVEDAFEAAASFATQPLPAGNRVAVLTSVGGWGVLTADAMAGTTLDLVELPSELRAELDAKLPPRWSRNNPIDMAGGETRDTIPEVLELIAAHPDIDSVIFLGLGIQSNTAALMRSGPFYPDHGIERIVDFHERQDARYATTAAEVSERHGKPILVATELAVAAPDNAGVVATRRSGRLCYAAADRAVRALDAMSRYATFRQRRGL